MATVLWASKDFILWMHDHLGHNNIHSTLEVLKYINPVLLGQCYMRFTKHEDFYPALRNLMLKQYSCRTCCRALDSADVQKIIIRKNIGQDFTEITVDDVDLFCKKHQKNFVTLPTGQVVHDIVPLAEYEYGVAKQSKLGDPSTMSEMEYVNYRRAAQQELKDRWHLLGPADDKRF